MLALSEYCILALKSTFMLLLLKLPEWAVYTALAAAGRNSFSTSLIWLFALAERQYSK
jgi:hypothetical protein